MTRSISSICLLYASMMLINGSSGVCAKLILCTDIYRKRDSILDWCTPALSSDRITVSVHTAEAVLCGTSRHQENHSALSFPSIHRSSLAS